MPGEPEEWTVSTLKSHFTALMEGEREKNDLRFNTSQRAIEKAEAAVERRLEGMNEFRASLADQARLLMPRLEADSRISALAEQIRNLESRIDRQEGRGSGLNAGWGYLIGAVGLIAGLIGIVLRFI